MNDLESTLEAQKNQVYTSLPFYNWIKDKDIDMAHYCVEVRSGYRYANPVYGPLTIVGSISDGGRFNIGGAQMSSTFLNLQKRGAIYLASTERCAKVEACKPVGKHKLYKVESEKPLKLWDLKKVIKDLNYPNLLSEVYASHGEKIWAYQKVPTISQILANHLRDKGGTGIIFNSTIIKEDLNIALFFDDDKHIESILNFSEL